MEQRLIGYTKGITRHQGDMMCDDGELMECVNLKCEGGELKPLLWPMEADFTLQEGEELLYIHKSGLYKNYFVMAKGELCVFNLVDGARKDLAFKQAFEGELKFESIGNTVIVLASDGLHYLLWKNDDYKYLGQKLPECSLSFGLQGEFKCLSENNYIRIDFKQGYTPNSEEIQFGESDYPIVNNYMLGGINKFIEGLHKEGKFVFPFFVRYAYRLYDGTLTMHSAPILMIAGSYNVPFVTCYSHVSNNNITSMDVDVAAIGCSLDYQLVNQSVKSKLEDWSDIVKSVDVFISAPIYTYNQNKKIEKIYGIHTNYADNVTEPIEKMKVGTYSVCKLVGGDHASGGYTELLDTNSLSLLDKYQRLFIPEVYQLMRKDGVGKYIADVCYSQSVTDEKIKDCSSFYFLKSLTIKELPYNERKVINVDEDYLLSLESRERMDDEYLSHDKFMPNGMYSYNGRLNLHGVTRERFEGFSPDSLVQYTNGATQFTFIDKTGSAFFEGAVEKGIESVSLTDKSTDYCRTFYYQLYLNDCAFAYKESAYKNYDLREVGHYIYHPSNDGKMYDIGAVSSNGLNYIQNENFQSHKFLNGKYNYVGLRRIASNIGSFDAEEGGSALVYEPNKIYTSEVNNPFVFPARGVNTIGTGDVLGIASTTSALSQGQFGQFPLIVLTSDGIWAMTVNDEGFYSTKQVMIREVCNNPNSIVQTDNLVFFTSEKGLMAIDGSAVKCVSEHMNGLSGKVRDYKRIGDMLKSVTEINNMVAACDDKETFVHYLKGCKMGYHYRDNSIYICNGDYSYVYVYNIGNGTITKLCDSAMKTFGFVNDYPDTLMLAKDIQGLNTAYSLLKEQDWAGDAVYGFAMSRPMKLGNPAVMKRIRQVENIKNVYDKNSFAKYALWGSNDCVHWYYVGSYTGGFKYYRMGLFTKLRPTEGVMGSVVMIEDKRANKLR